MLSFYNNRYFSFLKEGYASRHSGIAFVLLAVSVFAFVNFFKSIPFQLVEFDSFEYLAFSKSIYSASEIYVPPIRSPLTSLVVVPPLLVARFFMVLFYIGTSVLIYMLGLKLFRDRFIAVFASLVYGLSWWMLVFQTSPMSDLPGMFLFLLGLVVWLKKEKRATAVAGIIFGFAFLVRFDMAFLIFPLLFFTKKEWWPYFIAPFLGVAVFLELALDAFVYGQFVYAPWEFFKLNFSEFHGSVPKDFFYVARTLFTLFPIVAFLAFFSLFVLKRHETKVLASILLPFLFFISYCECSIIQPFEPRIFVVKFLPVLALLSGNFFVAFKAMDVSPHLKRFVPLALLVLIVGVSSLRIANIHYGARKFEEGDCVSGNVCSNFNTAVEYYCEIPTQIVKPTLSTAGRLGESCEYFVYFKDISEYNKDVDAYLRSTFKVHGENNAAVIYQLAPSR